ncbi:hypothetical protein BVRB_9g218910 isoform C [Beta vulgaris subsp. vulgaris]|nr:hypothetical protein BVRB_9g218910 isoform C [Beta vulgaris subsp. vulgaris]
MPSHALRLIISKFIKGNGNHDASKRFEQDIPMGVSDKQPEEGLCPCMSFTMTSATCPLLQQTSARKYSDIMTLAKPLKSYRRHTYRSYTGHVTVEAPLLVDHLCVMLHLSVLGADSNSAS